MIEHIGIIYFKISLPRPFERHAFLLTHPVVKRLSSDELHSSQESFSNLIN